MKSVQNSVRFCSKEAVLQQGSYVTLREHLQFVALVCIFAWWLKAIKLHIFHLSLFLPQHGSFVCSPPVAFPSLLSDDRRARCSHRDMSCDCTCVCMHVCLCVQMRLFGGRGGFQNLFVFVINDSSFKKDNRKRKFLTQTGFF